MMSNVVQALTFASWLLVAKHSILARASFIPFKQEPIVAKVSNGLAWSVFGKIRKYVTIQQSSWVSARFDYVRKTQEHINGVFI